MVCEVRPQKDDPNRTRITIGGSRIIYPGDVATKTASLELVKLIINSVLSRHGAKFACFDIKTSFIASSICVKKVEIASIGSCSSPSSKSFSLHAILPHPSLFFFHSSCPLAPAKFFSTKSSYFFRTFSAPRIDSNCSFSDSWNLSWHRSRGVPSHECLSHFQSSPSIALFYSPVYSRLCTTFPWFGQIFSRRTRWRQSTCHRHQLHFFSFHHAVVYLFSFALWK